MAKLTPEQQAAVDAVHKTYAGVFGDSVGGTAQQVTDKATLGLGVKNGVEHYDTFGGKTWDDTVNGYRSTGAALQGRAAPTLNQADANQARGYEIGSLGLLQNAANGGAPSQAALVGQGLSSSALEAGQQAGGAARGGPGAQIAGVRAAMTGTGQQMAQNQAQVQAMRNKESAADMGAFAGAAAGTRAQDIGAATTNAQLEAQQRALNEAGQQNYERMAQDTRNTQQQTGMAAQGQQNANTQALAQINQTDRAAEQANVMTGVNTIAGVTTGGLSAAAQAGAAKARAATAPAKPDPTTGSDRRMKYNVGSLGHLMRGH